MGLEKLSSNVWSHYLKIYVWLEGRALYRLRRKRVSGRSQRFFRSEPSEVSKTERMKFIAIKTDDGIIKGKLAFYCRMLHVSHQGFYKYLSVKDRP